MIYDLRGISFSYQAGGRAIIRDASLSLAEGEVLSILGPNGSGKSTLFHCMTNLLRPTKGQILLQGRPLEDYSARDFAQVVAYVQQSHTPVFDYTVRHFVTLGRASRVGILGRPKASDIEAAENALDELGITHLADKPYTEISGGERQQVVIARALAQEPKVILLDEPTAHLDFGNQLRILGLVRRMSLKGYSIAMTTHDPNHAILLGGKTAVLDREGHLQCGSAGQQLTEDKLCALYRTGLCLAHVPEAGRDAVLGVHLGEE